EEKRADDNQCKHRRHEHCSANILARRVVMDALQRLTAKHLKRNPRGEQRELKCDEQPSRDWIWKTWCAHDRRAPNNRYRSATAAHEARRLQPRRHAAVRCHAWLGVAVNLI